MKLLPLPLKKKWFDLIKSRIKKEEYRQVKPYWITRFLTWPNKGDNPSYDRAFYNELIIAVEYMPSKIPGVLEKYHAVFNQFDGIDFTNGYGKQMPNFKIECLNIDFGEPKVIWAENTKRCFVIKLGNIMPDHKIKTKRPIY